MSHDTDLSFMKRALELAQKAGDSGEVPVGAIVVCENQIISEAFNQKESAPDPTAHAEMLAIRGAAEKKKVWRLSDCVMYVTLEPCAMCAAAIMSARIARVVYAARDERSGFMGSHMCLHQDPSQNHKIELTPDILAAESAALLNLFFKGRRSK